MKHTAELAIAYIILENRLPKGALHYCFEVFEAMRERGFTEDQSFGAIENLAKEFRLAIVVMPGSRDGYGLDPDYEALMTIVPEFANLARGAKLWHFRNNGDKTWPEAELEFRADYRTLRKFLRWYCKTTGKPMPPDAKKPGRPRKKK